MNTLAVTIFLLFMAYCIWGFVLALREMFREGDRTTYVVEERAWFMLCPVWIADHGGNLVPIPRTPFLDPWFEMNLWLAHAFNWVICFTDSGRCGAGFVFHHVADVDPFELTL